MAGETGTGSPGGPGPGASGAPQRVQPISARTVTTHAQLLPYGCRLHGWNCRETTGAAGAVVELYDGTGTSGQFLGTMGLGNGVSQFDAFNDKGVHVQSGIYANVVTGSADVVVYVQLEPESGM